MSGQQWWTTVEVAEHYRVSEHTVRTWRKRAVGPKAVHHGNHVIYARAEIERYDADLRAAAGYTDVPQRLRAVG